ncbi:LysM peptidoglycan-binding domain-containing protein [Microcella sp.]|uniref:LysM peptidoglycan-binding domain-containing protein n=1 Tax=Microcella sp. TaxID=1913979 RepID=UPI0025F3EBBF|nr:LysM peptidoglycan-binding domain-containing protein [Microcella sp.]
MSAVIYDHRFASTMPSVGLVPRTRLRLTRRGRAVIAVLVSLPLVIALVSMSLNGGGATATSTSGDSAAVTTVTVEAGQSLWSLAATIAPDSSTADVVADLMSINALESASVVPGQQLVVPERYVD